MGQKQGGYRSKYKDEDEENYIEECVEKAKKLESSLQLTNKKMKKMVSLLQSIKNTEESSLEPNIEEVAKIYSEWKGEQCNEINTNNFLEYEKEYKEGMSKEIFEKLTFMNLSEEDVENNLLFYWRNIDKLIKVNEIINNIKFAEFYDSSPIQVLAKIVPENELKKLKSEETLNNNEEKEEEIEDKNYQICPEYILPDNWDNLFKLQISDKAIEKLYIESKIMKIARYYYLYKNEKNEPIETWLETINENNYQKYEEQFKEEFGKILEEDNKIKEMLPSLTQLKVDAKQIKENLEYYSNNFDQLKKINEIIENIKRLNLYELNPNEAYKKLTGDNQTNPVYPLHWEDLFKLEIDKWYINILYASVKNYIKKKQSEKERKREQKIYQTKYEEIAKLSKEEKKEEIFDDLCNLNHFSITLDYLNRNPDYYINNYHKFIYADKAIDIAKESKFYDTLNPRKIYKRSFKEKDDTLPEKWETLFELKWDTEKIFEACKIESVKKKYNEFDKEHDWKYYNKLINADNYDKYSRDFDDFVCEYEKNEKKKKKEAKINELNKMVKYIEKYNVNLYIDWINSIIEYEKEIKLSGANIDIKKLEKYEEIFKGYKQEITKEKKKAEREKREIEEREEREERQYYNNNSSRSNYNSSSSSNNNNDLKKAYIILCNHCKNKCVYCHKELKGDIGKSTSYGLHKKCQTSSCYICGKSRDTKERQTSYLCKSCYGSRKADNTKCLDCQKSFKG